MDTLCFYISDYGYGHATRSIAIIRGLIRESGAELRIIICSSKSINFIRESLKDVGEWITFREVSTDLGYILKEGSIEPDLERLKTDYLAYIKSFQEIIDREINFLKKSMVSLVVSDISPIPFVAAARAGIESVGISNFTWYTAYKRMLDEKLLAPLYEAYSQMHYYVSLPGAFEPNWGRKGHFKAGFYCRKPNAAEVMDLRSQLNTDSFKTIIYFALGMSISVNDLNEIDMWKDKSCLFIVSSNMDVDRANVIRIPASYTESQHYLAVSDLVISKPGWGTISEAVCFDKPLLLVNRKNFEEDQNTVKALKNIHPYWLIEYERLKRISITKELVQSLKASVTVQKEHRGEGEIREIVLFLRQLLY